MVEETHMSTQANIAFVQKAYADFLAGDIASILAALTDDIEWITPGKGIPTEGTRHGKAEVAKVLRDGGRDVEFHRFSAARIHRVGRYGGGDGQLHGHRARHRQQRVFRVDDGMEDSRR